MEVTSEAGSANSDKPHSSASGEAAVAAEAGEVQDDNQAATDDAQPGECAQHKYRACTPEISLLLFA